MFARQPILTLGVLLVLALFSVLLPAGAQERWPPWQSYGEAEDAARKKAGRRVKSSEITLLNRQIARLKAAGKHAEALPLAEKALALAEKKGPDSPDVAKALDTLAELYEAENKYAEAEPLLKRALAIREKAPGQPDVAASRERLAATYDKLGRAADAQALRVTVVTVETNGKGAVKPKKAAEPEAERAKAMAEAEEAKRAAEAERTEESRAQEQASKKSAQAEEKGDGPALTPLPRFSARRMAPPADGSGSGGSSSAAPPGADTAPEAALPPGADVDEMKPGAPASEPMEIPAADGAEPAPVAETPVGEAPSSPPAADAGPPPEGAFGGAPPPVANGAPSADEPSPPPPPVAEAPKPVPPPPLAGGSGQGAPPPQPLPSLGAAPAPAPPAAARTAKQPPAKVTAAPSGGSVVAAAPAPEPDWQVVPVYWGTDRAVQPNAQRLAFGSDRARKLQVGEALITVPKVHEVPNVERPWVVRIPYFDVTIYAEKEDPKSHFTVKEIKALTKEELLAQVKTRLGEAKLFKDQAVVFVHGYNTSFDNALYRTAQIAYDLDFDGATFLYSWPSGGAVASYTYDRESAQASEPYLREFLDMVVKQTGAKSISIIAHSMGNQPLMDVLRDMRSSTPEGVEISQIVLAAPDVDADSFTNLARTIKGLAKNVTLYVASNDRALIVSRNFWGSYRAGDVPPAGPLIIDGIDTIDVTAASTDTFAFNHSGYASNNKLLEDIGELLRTGLRPPEMRALKPGKITGPAGDYWRFAPTPP